MILEISQFSLLPALAYLLFLSLASSQLSLSGSSNLWLTVVCASLGSLRANSVFGCK